MKHLLKFGFPAMLIFAMSCQLEPWQPADSGQIHPFTPEPCNGDTSLCGKSYTDVVYPTTHKSYNYELGVVNYLSPSQKYPITHQLQDGIRALSLDVYNENGQVIVANKNTLLGNLLGSEPLSNVLSEVRAFMDANPREVVTLLLTTSVPAVSMQPAFESAGLTSYLYAHTGPEWPTLDSLIRSGKRVVVFSNMAEFPASEPWYNFSLATMFENPTPASRSEWSCMPGNGSTTSPMYLFHHRVGIPLLNTSNEDSARAVNQFDVLFGRIVTCAAQISEKPNFVAVDYYSAGDLFTVCDSLNHLP